MSPKAQQFVDAVKFDFNAANLTLLGGFSIAFATGVYYGGRICEKMDTVAIDVRDLKEQYKEDHDMLIEDHAALKNRQAKIELYK